MTTITPPSTETIRARLLKLNRSGVQKLAEESGVPFHTIWKIRQKVTENPGMETVRKFVPAMLRMRPS